MIIFTSCHICPLSCGEPGHSSYFSTVAMSLSYHWYTLIYSLDVIIQIVYAQFTLEGSPTINFLILYWIKYFFYKTTLLFTKNDFFSPHNIVSVKYMLRIPVDLLPFTKLLSKKNLLHVNFDWNIKFYFNYYAIQFHLKNDYPPL